jgi:hypothetical protein
MELTSLKNFLLQKDTKIIIIAAVSGKVVQIMCQQYIKKHPELFEKKDNNPKDIEPGIKTGIKNRFKKLKLRRFFPRGGALVETATALKIVEFLATHGSELFVLVTSGGIVVKKILTGTAISTYLYEASPQAHIERKRFILVDGEKIYIDYCAEGLEFLFTVMEKNHLPYEENEKVVCSALDSMKLDTMNDRVRFVLCIVTILFIFFSTQNMTSYYILLKNLIKAIKEGRIPKVVGRAIIRKLRKRGMAVDPELLDAVNS